MGASEITVTAYAVTAISAPCAATTTRGQPDDATPPAASLSYLPDLCPQRALGVPKG